MGKGKKGRMEKQALANMGKLFCCNLCKDGRNFINREGLLSHGNSIAHKGVYEHCQECEILFKTKELLDEHNTEEHPLVRCPTCHHLFRDYAVDEHGQYCFP